MSPSKMSLVLPIVLIGIGVGWLLSAAGFLPGIDWVWTLGLALVGVLTFIVGGFDKVTVVIGPFFIIASCLSVLRQTNRLSINIEVPLLVIASGILSLVARSKAVPIPRWLIQDSAGQKKIGEE